MEERAEAVKGRFSDVDGEELGHEVLGGGGDARPRLAGEVLVRVAPRLDLVEARRRRAAAAAAPFIPPPMIRTSKQSLLNFSI